MKMVVLHLKLVVFCGKLVFCMKMVLLFVRMVVLCVEVVFCMKMNPSVVMVLCVGLLLKAHLVLLAELVHVALLLDLKLDEVVQV